MALTQTEREFLLNTLPKVKSPKSDGSFTELVSGGGATETLPDDDFSRDSKETDIGRDFIPKGIEMLDKNDFSTLLSLPPDDIERIRSQSNALSGNSGNVTFGDIALGLGGDLWQAAQNSPQSAINFMTDMFEMVANPLETLKGLGGLAVGLVQKAIPGAQNQEVYVDAMMDHFSNRYGSLEEARETFREDPVGFFGDVAMVLSGAGGAARGLGALSKSARISNAGGTLLRAGAKIDPATAITRGGVMIKGRGAVGAAEKAQKLTTEILDPSKLDLQNFYANSPNVLNAVDKATDAMIDVITKSEDFPQLQDKTRKAKISAIEARNQIIENNNFDVSGEYINRAEEFILDQVDRGQITDAEFNAMSDVIKQERDFIGRQERFSRMDAQKRKETLQGMTDTLLKKREKGTLTGEESGRQAALDKMREGLKLDIEGSVPEEAASIRSYNEQFAGLKKAENLIAGKRSLADKAVTPTVMQKILEPLVSLFGGGTNTAFFIARQAAKMESNLKSTTAKIEKLRKRAKGMRKGEALDKLNSQIDFMERMTSIPSAIIRLINPVVDEGKNNGDDGSFQPSNPEAQTNIGE